MELPPLPVYFELNTSIRTAEFKHNNPGPLMILVQRILENSGAKIEKVVDETFTVEASYEFTQFDVTERCGFETHLFESDNCRIVEWQRRHGSIFAFAAMYAKCLDWLKTEVINYETWSPQLDAWKRM